MRQLCFASYIHVCHVTRFNLLHRHLPPDIYLSRLHVLTMIIIHYAIVLSCSIFSVEAASCSLEFFLSCTLLLQNSFLIFPFFFSLLSYFHKSPLFYPSISHFLIFIRSKCTPKVVCFSLNLIWLELLILSFLLLTCLMII